MEKQAPTPKKSRPTKPLEQTKIIPEAPMEDSGASDNLNIPRPWQHPQAWVPLEISFYLFLAPFIFWPLAIAAMILQIYSQDLEGVPLENLKNYTPPTVTFIHAANGSIMAEIYNEHRLVIPLTKIPPMVINAFLATEDSSFYQHQGVDLVSIFRAALANFQAGHTVQGASTITQQMIRTFFLTNEKTIDRKLKEMILAWRVERLLSKDEILYLYLNRIYLGRGAYGIESASRLYFGKTTKDLTLGEAALLAGQVKAPGSLRAYLGTERSRERLRYVINRMLTVGFITEEEARSALNTPLNFLPRRQNLFREVAPQFSEVVRLQANDLLGSETVLNDGLHIYTTLDLKAQAMAEDAVREGLDNLARRQHMSPLVSHYTEDQVSQFQNKARESLENRPLLINQEPAGIVTRVISEGAYPGLEITVGDQRGFMAASKLDWLLGRNRLDKMFTPNDLIMVRAVSKDETGLWEFSPAPPAEIQGALVLMENSTGHVIAMVGGRDFGLPGIGHSDFNRAVSALRQPGSSFKPFVYTAALDNGYTEASVIYDVPISYPDGPGKTWRPKNYGGKHSGPMTLYEAILRSVNVVAVKICDVIGPQTVVDYAHKMGITSELTPTLSLALGASEVTLLELTTAYTTFPNLGSWSWPTFITQIDDRWGRTVQKFQPYLTEAISPQTAYIMIDMLSGVASRGTAAKVAGALKVPVAGKTGTTNSQADALFVGFTPEYTCGVWVGRDVRITLGNGEQGGRTAAPIFIDFMLNFLSDKETGHFNVPQGVIRQKLLASDEEDSELGQGRSYVFKVNEIGRGHIDTNLGDSYEPTEGPNDATAMSQDELDRRLREFLDTDYNNASDSSF